MKKETFKPVFEISYKIYFRDQTRVPIIGMFVKHNDNEDLRVKGFVRFVTKGKLDNYNNSNSHIMWTRLFSISDFSSIKIVEHEAV